MKGRTLPAVERTKDLEAQRLMLLPRRVCRVPHLQRVALLVLLVIVGSPASSSACDWSPKDIVDRFERSTDVFIARVVKSPWVRRGREIDATGGANLDVRLVVETRYKNATFAEVPVEWAGDCTFPFTEADRYVVFASIRDGHLFATRVDEPLLIAEDGDAYTKQQAALAIQYGEARAAGRSVALVYGRVEFADAQTAASIGGVRVRAEAAASGGWSALTFLGPGPCSYGLVLPPGDYSLWVERDGVRISPVAIVKPVSAQQSVEADFTGAWLGTSEGRK